MTDLIKQITALRTAIAEPEQEPMDFVSLMREADQVVRGKPTWKRFIDGTPLSNDIAVWMTVFAQDVARRAAPPQRQPLTINEVEQILAQHSYAVHGDRARYIVRMTEEAHGIGEKK